ncbi:MAG: hypothetical protein K1Y36_12895 [Blastocatellia bacterium]|nr:hypothetical protein [Blastocatellia bacterium]
MMKITAEHSAQTVTVKLEGALTQEWVRELLLFWHETFVFERERTRRIDLREVTFVDEAGKALLALLHRDGAELLATDLLIKTIVAEITRPHLLEHRN